MIDSPLFLCLSLCSVLIVPPMTIPIMLYGGLTEVYVGSDDNDEFGKLLNF